MEKHFRNGAAAAIILLTGCQSQTELGSGGSMVSGSAGAAGAQNSASQLTHCAKPLGTAALVEPDANATSLLTQVGLQSPTPLLRLMMAQSNCFRVVDRGAALGNIQTEQSLRQGGMLQSGSTTALGRMVTVQYLITPNVIFSNPNAGGVGGGLGLAGLIPGGALIGAVAAGMRVQEAQTTLFLTDAQSGEQTAVAEGSAKARDFAGSLGLGGIGGGIAGFGGIGGYGNTAEGKLIAAAFLDSFSKLVPQVQASQPNLPTTQPTPAAYSAPSGGGGRGDRALTRNVQSELIRLGILDGVADGSAGPKTRSAISAFEQTHGLPVDGQASPGLLSALQGAK